MAWWGGVVVVARVRPNPNIESHALLVLCFFASCFPHGSMNDRFTYIPNIACHAPLDLRLRSLHLNGVRLDVTVSPSRDLNCFVQSK